MATVLYDPAVNSDILASGNLGYGQIPVAPIYPRPPFNLNTQVFTPVPDLLAAATQTANGVTLNTNGSVFNGIPGYNVLAYAAADGNTAVLTPSSTFSANANTGYAGFTNYTVDFGDLDLNNLGIGDLATIEDSLTFEPVNPSLPALDATVGFTVAFDLAILEEASAANRAGFSVLVVSNDPTKEIEIGFKTAGADRAFAQSANFTEAEDSSGTALDFSVMQTYWLSVVGDRYSLAANGVEILSGSTRNYNFNPAASNPPLPAAANPYQTANFLFWGDNTDQAYAEFTLGKVSILPLQTLFTSDLYDDYLATHADLAAAFGYNLDAAKAHYLNFGFTEERLVDGFAEDVYLASHLDLINAFGYNLDAATRHFIESGRGEGRGLTFIPELYLAAYQDLQAAYGDDLTAATRHYIEFGAQEGRDPLLGFDGGAYIASHADLITAFGFNPAAGRAHFVNFGYAEGREVTFDPDDYLASYGDLIGAFGYNLAAATQHYITLGVGEGRAPDLFDEVAYLGKYGDLQAAFGNNLAAATRHYIEFGFAEGRTA